MPSDDTVHFITHPDVVIDPAVPVPDWPLSARGHARMQAALRAPWIGGIRTVWTSPERKARDGAAILSAHLGLTPRQLDGLHENDRSATGYLPGPEFTRVADAFFARPTESVHGWERAVDAQSRIIAALRTVCAASEPGDIAVVAHGGVGALLLAHLRQLPISRTHDQPGPNGGCLFTFSRNGWTLRAGWKLIDG